MNCCCSMTMNEQIEITSLPGPGKLLRKKRLELGIDTNEIARELFLSSAQVEALEENRFDDLPGPTYVVGYWRSYSSLLNIDLSREIENHKSMLELPSTNIVLEPDHQRAHGNQEQSRKRSALIFLVLSALFLVTLWYWQNPENSFFRQWVATESDINGSSENLGNETVEGLISIISPDEESSMTEILPEPNLVDESLSEEQIIRLPQYAEPANSEINNSDETVNNNAVAEAELLSQGSDRVVEVLKGRDLIENQKQKSNQEQNSGARSINIESDIDQSASDASSLQTDSSNMEVVDNIQLSDVQDNHDFSPDWILFDVEEQTWLDVRDSKGEKLIYRVVKNGESMELNGVPPFSVFIGASAGVKVSYLGSPVDFEPHKSGLFARFQVGQSQ